MIVNFIFIPYDGIHTIRTMHRNGLAFSASRQTFLMFSEHIHIRTSNCFLISKTITFQNRNHTKLTEINFLFFTNGYDNKICGTDRNITLAHFKLPR